MAPSIRVAARSAGSGMRFVGLRVVVSDEQGVSTFPRQIGFGEEVAQGRATGVLGEGLARLLAVRVLEEGGIARGERAVIEGEVAAEATGLFVDLRRHVQTEQLGQGRGALRPSAPCRRRRR